MKKILFLCPHYFDLYKVFQSGIERFSGCEVHTVVYREVDFKYKGLQQFQNFLSKHLFGKNLKSIWKSEQRISAIQSPEQYDYMLVICPELVHPVHLDYLRSQVGRSIAYYWDGFDHFPAYKRTIHHFDVCYSFDPVDAQRYGLRFITNFYFEDDDALEVDQDLFFLSRYDSRFPELQKIVRSFECRDMRISVHQYTTDPVVMAAHSEGPICFFDRPVAFADANAMLKRARIVLDLQKNIQRGLTFRVFEAMGFRKKLITTNTDIVNYDFYNPTNIFVWRDDTQEVPVSFLDTPYEALPDAVFRKYSQEQWVKKVFEL